MVEERAQRCGAAIIAAEIVGYSRLMGQDDAGHRGTTEIPAGGIF
ncbi:MAG: hypothetical protein O3A84_04460 [Proteobacteria bacterium]|nr:hypothetical protein [Pseudomonadota bacterium]